MIYKVLIFVFSVGCYAAPQQQNHANREFIRPCYLNDYNCIRDNLAANSKCNKNVVGWIPSAYMIKTFRFETPFFNASYIDNNLVVRNHHNCRIAEFFYNVKKDSAVLAVECRGLVVSSNRTLIQHNTFKEDSIYSYSSTWEYPIIRMTTHIRNANRMDVCNSFVYTDVAAMPKFVLNPNDKQTANFLSKDLSYLNIYERETFFYRGFGLFHRFISSIICNFGCYY
ncbi:fibrohexamerin-like [Pectinophora gossypiella]|uniref:fibrohexamerin-like n=1 Tax=Pectinophora gossypiella TaxID=13191 RepID=UPI00214F4EDD|nr:fibrohexamerin-like [Pectinophora gossypiella]XP_049882882.1 fibrohexamerin-like [Pectinophora gossypiella]